MRNVSTSKLQIMYLNALIACLMQAMKLTEWLDKKVTDYGNSLLQKELDS